MVSVIEGFHCSMFWPAGPKAQELQVMGYAMYYYFPIVGAIYVEAMPLVYLVIQISIAKMICLYCTSS